MAPVYCILLSHGSPAASIWPCIVLPLCDDYLMCMSSNSATWHRSVFFRGCDIMSAILNFIVYCQTARETMLPWLLCAMSPPNQTFRDSIMKLNQTFEDSFMRRPADELKAQHLMFCHLMRDNGIMVKVHWITLVCEEGLIRNYKQ